jgi:hypothetical protein
MMDLWLSIQALWLADWVSLLVRAAIFWATWYLIALGIAHLRFGSGSEATDSAIFGMYVSMLIVTVLAVVLGLYYWLSIPVSISLGLLAFTIPLILTLALGSRARA